MGRIHESGPLCHLMAFAMADIATTMVTKVSMEEITLALSPLTCRQVSLLHKLTLSF